MDAENDPCSGGLSAVWVVALADVAANTKLLVDYGPVYHTCKAGLGISWSCKQTSIGLKGCSPYNSCMRSDALEAGAGGVIGEGNVSKR